MIRLLVVEDDLDVAEWIEHCVSGAEREVRTVSSAAAARAASLEGGYRPDVLLLDYELEAGTDGVELLAALRGPWPRVPCVFVTVHWSGEVLDRIADTGAERVAKPFDPVALLGAVDRALAGRTP
jgi:CheY-like chemotaxis protein